MHPTIELKQITPLILAVLLLVCIAVLPTAQAVVPAPDGGYPGGNTAEGQAALLSLTSGGFNCAIGYLSLRNNATNSFNTAIGAGSLLANAADENTAVGAGALLSNTTGDGNTASGGFALFSNTTGGGNTAFGDRALFGNTAASENTAVGAAALLNNNTGAGNTAVGFGTLINNIVGVANTAEGASALVQSTGNGNTAVGHAALTGTTGNGNTALGFNAGSALTAGDNNIDIGADVLGVAGEANTLRVGNPNIAAAFIRGISGATVPAGGTVFVAANGQLGTMTSSARFKQGIQPMDKASEVLFALKPVTFSYRKEIDPAGTSQCGLVAEDVEKVNSDLVVRDEKGKPYSVRYDQVNAMLLNEFLKEHKAFIEEQHKVKKLEAIVAEQQQQVAALTAGLQRVSAKLELSKPAPQTVQNSQ